MSTVIRSSEAAAPEADATSTSALMRRQGLYADLLVGTPGDLLAQGIGEEADFADAMGTADTLRAETVDHRGVAVQLRRLPSVDGDTSPRFAVRVPVSEFERARRRRDRGFALRREALAAERERRIENAKAMGLSEREFALRGLPDSVDAYRDRALQSLDGYVDQMRKWTLCRRGGYAFDAATLARFEIVAGALQTLIERAPVRLDEAARESEIAERLQRAGLADEAEGGVRGRVLRLGARAMGSDVDVAG